MIEFYESGEPYLALAKTLGYAPSHATKKTHPGLRDRFKIVSLATLYGMGVTTLAQRLDVTPAVARHLLEQHRDTHRRFWRWSQAALDYAELSGGISSVFGWTLHVAEKTKATTIRNFPVQANGAEMLRLACILAHDRGVALCGVVHDAVLIEAPVRELEDAIATMVACMKEASAIVLGGFELRVDVETVLAPERWPGAEEHRVWRLVTEALGTAA